MQLSKAWLTSAVLGRRAASALAEFLSSLRVRSEKAVKTFESQVWILALPAAACVTPDGCFNLARISDYGYRNLVTDDGAHLKGRCADWSMNGPTGCL